MPGVTRMQHIPAVYSAQLLQRAQDNQEDAVHYVVQWPTRRHRIRSQSQSEH